MQPTTADFGALKKKAGDVSNYKMVELRDPDFELGMIRHDLI